MRVSIVLAALAWPLQSPSWAGAAGAQAPCPNEAARIAQPFGYALPDCRAYEQISPAQKNLADALGAIGGVRAAPNGEAVTYDSLGAFPLSGGTSEGSSQLFSTYLSDREPSSESAEGWLTQSLGPPVLPGGSAEPVGLSEDLRFTFERSDEQPPLTPEGTEGDEAIYMRDNATGQERLLFQLAAGEAASFYLVADAASDSRVFFESTNRLIEAAAPGVPNLYEWHEGALSLVDELPGGAAPSAGGGAGARGPGAEAQAGYFDRNAVSEDGSTAFFTDLGTGLLYERRQQPGGAGETTAISSGPAAWQAATPDGSHALYVEAGALYAYAVGEGESKALTPPGGKALGVLGISRDGSYVYFAAQGALAPGAVEGADNVYLAHEGSISLVSTDGEESDWATVASPEGSAPDEGVRSARVSADGQTLMFTSRGEIYLYEAPPAGATEEGALTCVSCNPSEAPATAAALLYHSENDGFFPPPTLSPASLPRNLSADGSRVFFETEEALLPSDSDGVMDVYEWERAGSGSCREGGGGAAEEGGSAEGGAGVVAGCLYLISSGTSEEPSYFAEASASGDDVLFFTRQSLLAEDEDELVDIYDARVVGGLPAQEARAGVAECSQESCRPPQAPLVEPGPPSSETFAGVGNVGGSANDGGAESHEGRHKHGGGHRHSDAHAHGQHRHRAHEGKHAHEGKRAHERKHVHERKRAHERTRSHRSKRPHTPTRRSR